MNPGDLISYCDDENIVNTFAIIISVDDTKATFIWADLGTIESVYSRLLQRWISASKSSWRLIEIK